VGVWRHGTASAMLNIRLIDIIDHSKSQLKQFASRTPSVADRRIPVARLERFGKLENDVLKAGDEVKSLARFTSTQRTAFRKLLKKYKKWTGSMELEMRFRTEVLDSPKSFTKLDLGPLLADYSNTLQQIRTLYEEKIQQSPRVASLQGDKPTASSSAILQLQSVVESGSKVRFDAAVAAVPLGNNGTFASYFVHRESVVELQVLLLHYSRYYTSRIRSDSTSTQRSNVSRSEVSAGGEQGAADYFALEADNALRFAQEQNSLTLKDREHLPGSTPQKARLCARWNDEEDALVSFCSATGKDEEASLRRKHVRALFDRSKTFPVKKAATSSGAEQSLAAVRQEYEKDQSLQLLYAYSSCRSRFVGTGNSQQRLVLATLDSDITVRKPHAGEESDAKVEFPFAILLVRQEGTVTGGLLAALDQSHLVERVPGFSMEYHAIWETCASPSITAPFWLPVLSRDIRKLPPPLLQSSSRTGSATPTSPSSANGITDSTTAAETARSDSTTQPEELEAPPVRSFRKKRRRGYPEQQPAQESQRYWSEYDHPEDGSDAGDAYVLYIDPNEKSSLERLFDKLGSLLGRHRRKDDEAALLTDHASLNDDGTSSDEEETGTVRHRSYGTLSAGEHVVAGPCSVHQDGAAHISHRPRHTSTMPNMTPICFAASLIILTMAYILAITGRHKKAYQVDFGVLFAVASSLFFAVVGFASLLRTQHVVFSTWIIGVSVLIVDAVGSGGLLAWMLG